MSGSFSKLTWLKIAGSVGVPFWLVLEWLFVGWTKIMINLHDHKAVTYDDLFTQYFLIFRYIGLQCLISFLVIFGLFMFVIPGLFLFQRLRFASYFVIDKNQSVIQALRSSWGITRGLVCKLWGFTLLSGILSAIGKIFIPAVIFLTPFLWQADISIYRQLTQED